MYWLPVGPVKVALTAIWAGLKKVRRPGCNGKGQFKTWCIGRGRIRIDCHRANGRRRGGRRIGQNAQAARPKNVFNNPLKKKKNGRQVECFNLSSYSTKPKPLQDWGAQLLRGNRFHMDSFFAHQTIRNMEINFLERLKVYTSTISHQFK